jgi:RHS repeat-associated protein
LETRFDQTQGKSHTYTYDDNSRLGGWTDGTTTEQYGYNSAGNMLTKTIAGALTVIGYPAQGATSVRPHGATHLAGVQKYWYDGNGNMTKRIAGSVNYSQTWTVENMIADVRTCTTTAFTTCTAVASYGYDAGNARYKKTEGGVTTIYFGDGYEKNLSTGAVTTYYHFGGKRIGLRKSTTGAAVTYLHGDHLGSASVATDNAGTVVNQQRYRPYGEIEAGGTGMPSDHGFTGQRWQVATGLVHMAAREYDPVLGRFISPDIVVPAPQKPQAFNRYSYVRNNPAAYVDPTGHCTSGDAECEAAWKEAQGALGFNPDGLFSLDTDMLRLISKWVTAGVTFKNTSFGFAWAAHEIGAVVTALEMSAKAIGGMSAAIQAFGLADGLIITRGINEGWFNYGRVDDKDNMTIHSAGAGDVYTAIHELGHIVDANLGVQKFNTSGVPKNGGKTAADREAVSYAAISKGWRAASSDRGTTLYGLGGPIEDFAESWSAFVYSKNDASAGISIFPVSSSRTDFIDRLFNNCAVSSK